MPMFLFMSEKSFFFSNKQKKVDSKKVFSNMQKKLAVETGNKATVILCTVTIGLAGLHVHLVTGTSI